MTGVVIIGASRAGKTRLTQSLARRFGFTSISTDIQFMYLNSMRPNEELWGIVDQFVREHEDWILEGDFSKRFIDYRVSLRPDYVIHLDIALATRLRNFMIGLVKELAKSKSAKSAILHIIHRWPWFVGLIKNRRTYEQHISSLIACLEAKSRTIVLKSTKDISAFLNSAETLLDR